MEKGKDRSNFSKVCGIAELIKWTKNQVYRDSWKRRGHVGVFIGGVARKFDRIENIIGMATQGYNLDPSAMPKGDESLTETVMDLFVYVGLWLTLIREDYPDEWKEFLKKNGIREGTSQKEKD